jgi:hypothetical protein
MAFDRSTEHVDTHEKSIVLLAVDLHRDDDSRYAPHPINLIFSRPDGTPQGEIFGFHFLEDKDSVLEESHKVYLARVALAPGSYRVVRVFGDANAFPFHGWFDVPLNSTLTVTPNTITYLGRVSAKLRPRQENEFRAGPVLPLIDQSVTGVSVSTWDIAIDNQADKDLAHFRDSFPVLATATIAVAPLPPFDRAKAQKAWEDGN